MHGGAAGSGAPRGTYNGNFRNGAHTTEAIADRQMLSALVAEVRAFARLVKE